MRVVFQLLSSSIGKKAQMALTGLLLCGFLVVHVIGNLFLYAGRQAFDLYAETLEAIPIVPLAELGLLALFLAHVVTALWVTYGNWTARPIAYEKTASAGGSTWGSVTMFYTGLFLLVFLAIHVKHFRLDKRETDLFGIVMSAFQNKVYAAFYVAAMAGLAFHLSHGFQSAFQTLGINHSKYTPLIKVCGLAFAGIALVFASIPIWAAVLRGTP